MKFILTKELGRLNHWLRILGYDSEYFDSEDMKMLFIRAFNEKRIIITKRSRISGDALIKVLYIKEDKLKEQIRILKEELRLDMKKGLFTRCSDCNTQVKNIERGLVRGKVPPYVFKTQKKFFQCPLCKKVFWKATHFIRARYFIDEVCS